jgi:hypothetical protein
MMVNLLMYYAGMLNLRRYSVLKIMFRIHFNIKGKVMNCDFASSMGISENMH